MAAALSVLETLLGAVIGQCQIELFPDIIRSIDHKAPIVLRSPNATRPWQHVLDPLQGYLMLAVLLYQGDKKINSGDSWNFGPSANSICTVLELAQALASLYGEKDIHIEAPPTSMHEARLLHLSIEKATSFLKWTPKYAFDQAVLKTGEWYKRTGQGENAADITKQQITEFMSL